MPRFSIPVPHRPQELDYSGCPAYVRMVLAFYGAEHAERDLRILLKTRMAGTGAVNVMLRLPELGFTATVARATSYELEQAVREGRPCIAQVFTEHLHCWDMNWMHDVVVVGFDENVVLVNDPAFLDAPKEVPREEFVSAWATADRLMIKIGRSNA